MRTRGIATIAGGLAIAGITLWIVGRAETPKASLRIDGAVLPKQFADVPLGARVTLDINTDHEIHAYVFTHHMLDGVAAWFPSPWLRTDTLNPLAAGKHTLPGVDVRPGEGSGKAISWAGPKTVGATDVVLILSEQPIDALSELIGRVRQASNRPFPDGSEAGLSLPDGMPREDLERSKTWPVPLLADAATAPTTDGTLRPVGDRPGVWSGCWKLVVRELKSRDEQLQEAFAPLQAQRKAGPPPETAPPKPDK